MKRPLSGRIRAGVAAVSQRRWLLPSAIAVGGLPLVLGLATAKPPPAWAAYEADQGSTHYAPLRQLDVKSIGALAPAWSYELGDTDVSAEPLVLPDRLIAVGRGGALVALDPGSGREIWRTDVGADLQRMRGFSYWRSADGRQARVFFANDTRLRAIDPSTGKLIDDFNIDLRQGLERDPTKIRRIASPTPGRVFGNVIILGSATGEDYEAPPGDVRAYDVLSGKLVWQFRTIPRDGDVGADTWPSKARTTAGGANVWGGLSVDTARGIAYFVTGSATYDFYGADRKGDNFFANSIVAVNATTGAYLWHFQTVHHDLWDYDLTASPVLLTVRRQGRPVPAVAVAGKTGFLYVFDRVTGAPIFPIHERPVPKSDVPGEHASPTQPFSTLPPFARQSITEEDLDPELPAAERAEWAKRLRAARNDGIFTPPGLRESVQMPGNHGGANWGNAGADPDNGRFYVISYDMPSLLKLEEGPDPGTIKMIERFMGRGAAVYAQNCQICHGADLAGQPPAIPSVKGAPSRMGPAAFDALIRQGRGTMPGFPDINKADLANLQLFLSGAPPQAVAAATDPLPPPDPSGLTRYRSSYGFMLSRTGDPVVAPPWQSLTAYDLNTGQRLWQTPVGTAPSRKRPTGLGFSKGGLAITRGGLVFVSTEADRRLHAYDAQTGRPVWSGELPSRPRGGLAVYEHRKQQFIVVPVGNAGGILLADTPSPTAQPGRNAYVAFALKP